MFKLNFTNKLCLIVLLVVSNISFASETEVTLMQAPIDSHDKASLQRGFKTFVNKCLSCHSAKYLRYKDVARDLGMLDKDGEVLTDLVQKNLNFISDKATDNMHTSMSEADAEKWFGVVPPDLSLVTRSRGTDWVYTYLHSFYKDANRPFGVNNTVFADVGMPHVLAAEQGNELPDYEQLHSGTVGTKANYDKMVTDLVNFMDYMGEPYKLKRQRIGVYVLLFLAAFTLFAYMLKREYWQDIDKKRQKKSNINKETDR